MEKHEFITKSNEIQKKIEALNCDLMALTEDYKKANAKFNIGAKVTVTTLEVLSDDKRHVLRPAEVEVGFVQDYELNIRLIVMPVIYRAKKTGECSRIRVHITQSNIIELFE